jgi:hypothetical protein
MSELCFDRSLTRGLFECRKLGKLDGVTPRQAAEIDDATSIVNDHRDIKVVGPFAIRYVAAKLNVPVVPYQLPRLGPVIAD